MVTNRTYSNMFEEHEEHKFFIDENTAQNIINARLAELFVAYLSALSGTETKTD